MRLFSNATLVLILLLSCSATTSSHAQPNDGPAYARQRVIMRGGEWNGGYGGQYPGGQYPRSQYPRHNGGGYYPYQPAIAGSWYTRPYPYHFDYYRGRFSTPQQANDCPCAKTQAEY